MANKSNTESVTNTPIVFDGNTYTIDESGNINDSKGNIVKDKTLINDVKAANYVSKQTPEVIEKQTIYIGKDKEPWFIKVDANDNFQWAFNSEEGIDFGNFGLIKGLWSNRLVVENKTKEETDLNTSNTEPKQEEVSYLDEGDSFAEFVSLGSSTEEDDEQPIASSDSIFGNNKDKSNYPEQSAPSDDEKPIDSSGSIFSNTKPKKVSEPPKLNEDYDEPISVTPLGLKSTPVSEEMKNISMLLDDECNRLEVVHATEGKREVWGAVVNPKKRYLDEDKKVERYETKYKSEGHERDEAIFRIKPKEWLSNIINRLPHGLIDKQVTGIGATSLELKSKRHSIIVTPTRALALNKMEDNFLYVGSIVKRTATTKGEIIAYLNDENVKYKKILVVADSIDKVIDAICENDEDVYMDYFLLVDEIDTLQSDNHYRPVLSRVIDHYFKFKKWKRALLSATVRKFTHPKLQNEPVITIKSTDKQERKIDIHYTNNINSLLLRKIIELTEQHPKDKILIAYNSVVNILHTIKSLPEALLSKFSCGILCSEASKDETGVYYKTLDRENNLLSCKINFMTCSYFAGIDIEDKYHLITVCDSRKVYSALPINKIIQIYGRCRIPNGILSDTIIYNDKRLPLSDLDTYRESLSNKAKKVIDLLDKADELKKGDADLTDLFSRIHKVIIERATEYLFNQQSFELTRETIDGNKEISYFNIDALYEKMKAYSKYYSRKEGLYNHIKKIYPSAKFYDSSDSENDIDNSGINDSIKAEYNSKLQLNISSIKDELVAMNKEQPLTDNYLDKKINSTKRGVMDYYKRIKDHYKYYDIEFLSKIFADIALKNRKAYRNLNNQLSFIALDNKHPFKAQVHQGFKVGKKYSSEEIANILSTIIKDQNFKTVYEHQRSLINHFKCFVDYTYTGGVYLIKGYNPKYNNIEVPKPIKRIPKDEYATKYFEF